MDAPLGCGSDLLPTGRPFGDPPDSAPAWHRCTAPPMDGVQQAQAGEEGASLCPLLVLATV